MSGFSDNIKKFFNGDFESFKDVEEQESAKVLAETYNTYKESLQSVLIALDNDDVAEAIVHIANAKELFESMNVHSEKIDMLHEGLDNVSLMLCANCSEDEVEECKDSLNIISESLEPLLKEAGAQLDDFDIGPQSDEDPRADMDHDTIDPAAVTADSEPVEPEPLTGLEEGNGSHEDNTVDPVGGDENLGTGHPVEDPNDMGEMLPQDQHEKVVIANEQKSAYEEGFEYAKKVWQKGIHPKEVFNQLTETDLSSKPYSYVVRYQEGLNAGLKYQEEVVRDTNPQIFEEDETPDSE